MPGWKDILKGDPVLWLLESDRSQPAIRYYTLRDILGRDENDGEVKAAKAGIMASGPVPVILAAQQPEGYWMDKRGRRYSETMRALGCMAQLGADGADPRIRTGCEYLLSQCIDSNGDLFYKDAHCTVGIIGGALIDFGWLNDHRLQTAMEWLAQTITGEGLADASNRDTSKRYDKSGNSSPPFACSRYNDDLPCAWGAIKAMIALNKVPPAQQTRNMHEAIKLGVDFLLSRDPAVADYPSSRGNRPSTTWFKFFYPIGTSADVLQNLEVMAALGQAGNPRLANALALVISKQKQQGRWLQENSSTRKLWVDIQEKKGRPSKWVTLRALRVLKAAYPETG